MYPVHCHSLLVLWPLVVLSVPSNLAVLTILARPFGGAFKYTPLPLCPQLMGNALVSSGVSGSPAGPDSHPLVNRVSPFFRLQKNFGQQDTFHTCCPPKVKYIQKEKEKLRCLAHQFFPQQPMLFSMFMHTKAVRQVFAVVQLSE